MGHAKAMEAARAIAVNCSDVLISNADEYNALYKQPPFDNKGNLQKLNGAYTALGSIAMKHKGKLKTHELNPLYWIELGNWAAKRKDINMMKGNKISDLAPVVKEQLAKSPNAKTAQKQQKELDKRENKEGVFIRYGKCFVCSGLVAYKLVKSKEFLSTGLSFEICKTAGVHHYFVVVGRTSNGGDPDPNTINDHANWGKDAFIIDVWQANLNQDNPLWGRTKDDEFGEPAVVDAAKWRYIKDSKGGHLSVCTPIKAPFTEEAKLAKSLKEDDM
jgi:hypothetical protein